MNGHQLVHLLAMPLRYGLVLLLAVAGMAAFCAVLLGLPLAAVLSRGRELARRLGGRRG